MNHEMFTGGVAWTNGYMIDQGMHSILIDAPEGIVAEIKARMKSPEYRLETMILTHGHFDHITDAAEIRELTSCEVLYHKADDSIITQPEIQQAFGAPLVPALNSTRFIAEGETLTLGKITFEVLHIPGHCPGNICLVWHAEKCVYVGDAIFRGSVGRTDLPNGSFKQLIAGIKEKLFLLPGEYAIYSGHGASTTIEQERKHNPYVTDSVANDDDPPELA